MKRLEAEVKALQAALEQAQATLTSPEIGRLSLKEQLSHRQVNGLRHVVLPGLQVNLQVGY